MISRVRMFCNNIFIIMFQIKICFYHYVFFVKYFSKNDCFLKRINMTILNIF